MQSPPFAESGRGWEAEPCGAWCLEGEPHGGYMDTSSSGRAWKHPTLSREMQVLTVPE